MIDEVPHTQHDIVLNMNLQGIPMMEIINRSQKNIVLGDDADDCYAPIYVKDEQGATQKDDEDPSGMPTLHHGQVDHHWQR